MPPSPVNAAKCDRRVRSPENIQKNRCAAVATMAAVVRERLIKIPSGAKHLNREVAHVTLGPTGVLADLAYKLINEDVGFGSYNAPESPRIGIDRQNGRCA